MLRPAEHLVHGIDGPVVLVSGRACALLNRVLGIDKLRAEVRGQDPELDQTLLAIRIGALKQAESSSTGTLSAPKPEPVRPFESQQNDTVSTTIAAAVLGIGPRAVTKAITDKRLAATKDDGGRYRITREELRRYTAER